MDPEQHRFRRPLRDLVSKSPFDVIVVGAGSAGCALVGKLCRERPDLNVLLVEAGAEAHTSDLIADPRQWLQTFGTANDWVSPSAGRLTENKYSSLIYDARDRIMRASPTDA